MIAGGTIGSEIDRLGAGTVQKIDTAAMNVRRLQTLGRWNLEASVVISMMTNASKLVVSVLAKNVNGVIRSRSLLL